MSKKFGGTIGNYWDVIFPNNNLITMMDYYRFLLYLGFKDNEYNIFINDNKVIICFRKKSLLKLCFKYRTMKKVINVLKPTTINVRIHLDLWNF